MTIEKGIEREIQEVAISLLIANTDLMALRPDVRHVYDESKLREAVQVVVECDQLTNENFNAIAGGAYYTARLSVMAMTSLDVDPQAKTMQRIAEKVRTIMHAWTAAGLNTSLTLCDVHGIVPQEPEALYDGSIVGRAHVVRLHIQEV